MITYKDFISERSTLDALAKIDIAEDSIINIETSTFTSYDYKYLDEDEDEESCYTVEKLNYKARVIYKK